MIVFTRRDLPYIRPALRERLGRGEIGIFPTDGGYALMGNALSAEARRRLGRAAPPVMVPHSLEWTRLVVAVEHRAGLDELVSRHAGTACLVLRHSGSEAPLPRELTPSGRVTLRFPRHWVRDLAGELTFPLLCLPVPGGMTRLEEVPADVARRIDFVVYEGPRPAVAPALVPLDAPPGGPAPCQAPPTSAPSRTPRPSGPGRSAARPGTSRSSGRSRASRSRPARS
ncbi:MAG TPA: Sua5/YciO/YrdC/YwlC family protein [Myxococcaceae bacterium]|nr:Sua5/YciO/YrdC/YwlC family protein [Myxococcaceae bacterium]